MKILGDRSALLWLLGSVVATCVGASALYFGPIAALALIGPVVALMVFPRHPKLGFLFWLLTVSAVPCWIGIGVAGVFAPVTTVSSFVALSCLLVGTRWEPNKADLCVSALLVLAAFGVAFGSSSGKSSISAFISMLTLWVAGYLVGRFVCEKAGIRFVKTSVGITFGVVGLLAIIEKLFGWHPFVGLAGMNSLAELWAPIQTRAGESRSEWAFGHSIALGGSLALAIPFLLSSGLKTRNKLVLLSLILVGVATTLSRGAMLAAGLTLILALLTAKNLRAGQRAFLFIFATILGMFTAISFMAVSDEAGSEVTNSSSYRVNLLTRLIGTLAPIGRAHSYMADASGSGQYGIYGSIDNAFMAVGLGFGWIAMALVIFPFAVMSLRLVRGRASFAEVALIGQLPVIATVAMITQYQVAVWMVVGLAAALAGDTSETQEGQSAPAEPELGRVGAPVGW
ncbi:hypothetical protein [Arthrobacter ruber]|uniref:hypothetical protein n=1 Tax=Arthrobacter ruber TaxID=1258893 RepID=UPI000CF48D5F|nr:hypothetical protein [Arthrobacter ruber]